MTGPVRPTRRQALTALSLVAAPLAVRDAAAAAPLATVLPERACVLTPQAVEGPYYFDPQLVRGDITEGRPGVPLRIRLQILDVSGCRPVEGARVDLWHSDALGVYSGYDRQSDTRDRSTKGETFLRGTQLADATGQVEFRTIYPGWYTGRTPHIHFEVFLDSKNVLTSQLYLPDALTEYIYTHVAPYNTRPRQRDTRNSNDGVLRGSGGGHETFLNIKEEADHYLGTLVIAADRTASGDRQRGGPPPGGPPPGGPPPGGLPPGGPQGGPQGGGPPREGPPPSTPAGSLVPGVAAD